jgi:hypothetical protein
MTSGLRRFSAIRINHPNTRLIVVIQPYEQPRLASADHTVVTKTSNRKLVAACERRPCP